jgi:hypothetical protein
VIGREQARLRRASAERFAGTRSARATARLPVQRPRARPMTRRHDAGVARRETGPAFGNGLRATATVGTLRDTDGWLALSGTDQEIEMNATTGGIGIVGVIIIVVIVLLVLGVIKL